MSQVREVAGPPSSHSFGSLDELCARYPWVRRHQPKNLEDGLRIAFATATVLVPTPEAQDLTKAEPTIEAQLTPFDAVRWLTDRPPIPADQERTALVQEGGDPIKAALRAYGEEVTPIAEGTLRTWLQSVAGKSIRDQEPFTPKVIAGDERVAAELRASGVTLRRRSRGLLFAPTPGPGWLLQPGPRTQQATAFREIAEAWGLGHYVPDCAAIAIDDSPYLAERPLPRGLYPLDDRRGPSPRVSLGPLLRDGVLHRWAILDYVLGNPDRLGSTVLTSERSAAYLVDNGGAFAEAFAPATDGLSFPPAYMTVWGPAGAVPSEVRRSTWPSAGSMEGVLTSWLRDLPDEPIKLVCAKRGLDASGPLSRLASLRSLAGSMGLSQALRREWVG